MHEDDGTVAWDDAAHGLGGPETLPAVLTWLALELEERSTMPADRQALA